MKFANIFFRSIICLIGIYTGAVAQITVTRLDFESGYFNSRRTQYMTRYSPPPMLDLGSASSSSQTFNFSAIAGTDTSRDTLEQEYVPPAGQVGSAQFPTASVASNQTLAPPFPGATLTSTQYFSVEDAGVYLLGSAIHLVLPPIFDTVFITHFVPKQLLVPLPLTLGTQRTGRDSVFPNPLSKDYDVTSRSYDANGYGTLTFPNGKVHPAIRVITDRVTEEYSGGVLVRREHGREATFVSQDASYLSFDVSDTGYVSGSTAADQVQFNIKQGTVDVQPISSEIPHGYDLLQNYPNPFNPSTSIQFTVPRSEYVLLKVYDVLGREVATLVDRQVLPGTYTVRFDAADRATGVYCYTMTWGGITQVRRMILLK